AILSVHDVLVPITSPRPSRECIRTPQSPTPFPYTTLFRSPQAGVIAGRADLVERCARHPLARALRCGGLVLAALQDVALSYLARSEEHTSELQSRENLVCRLLHYKKNNTKMVVCMYRWNDN